MPFYFYTQENGIVVRESDKSEEIYFEKGQTKQLVEQWKTKQLSPDRDMSESQVKNDAEIVQQGIIIIVILINGREKCGILKFR